MRLAQLQGSRLGISQRYGSINHAVAVRLEDDLLPSTSVTLGAKLPVLLAACFDSAQMQEAAMQPNVCFFVQPIG